MQRLDGNNEIARGNYAWTVKERSASPWIALACVATSLAVILLMLYRAMAYPGEEGGLNLSESGWAVLVAGVACFVLSVGMSAYLRHLTRPAGVPATTQAVPVLPEAPPAEAEMTPPAEPDLSQLEADERHLYGMIDEKGGEMLQRDLVATGRFSKAKVTRLLDKLERRGLLKRERHGMTNRVKLVR